MKPHARFLAEGEYDAWDAFADAAADGGIYSTATYLDALCGQAGGSFRVAAVEHDGRILAGIAVYEADGRWGKTVSPRSLLPYNGFVAGPSDSRYPSQREAATNACLHSLAECLEQANYLKLTARSRGDFLDARVFQSRGWEAFPTYTYVVPLDDPGKHWSLVDRDLKRQIRKCETHGYTLVEDDDFDSFMAFHVGAHTRKGFDSYLPEPRFRAFFETLRSQKLATLCHVRDDAGEAAASQLVLTGANRTCHIVAAGSDPRRNKDGVNAFLRWKSFERLSERGYAAVDLTDASLNSVSKFKSRFGATLKTSLAVSREGGAIVQRIGSHVESSLRRRLSSLGSSRG